VGRATHEAIPQLDRFREILDANTAQHGAKDLFPVDAHVRADVVKQCASGVSPEQEGGRASPVAIQQEIPHLAARVVVPGRAPEEAFGAGIPKCTTTGLSAVRTAEQASSMSRRLTAIRASGYPPCGSSMPQNCAARFLDISQNYSRVILTVDWPLVTNDAARFENLVASHLLKWVHYEQDSAGRDLDLRYFRDVDRREVDFVVTDRGRPIKLVECKWSDADIDSGLRYLHAKYPSVEAWQISAIGTKDYQTPDGIRVAPAIELLKALI
jgi:hypothetical protein